MNHRTTFLDVYGNPVIVEPHRWTISTSTGIHRVSWVTVDRAGEPLASLCREYVQNKLLNGSPIEAYNTHNELSSFARFYRQTPNTPMHTMALRYLTELTSKGNRWRWSRIRAFYRFFAKRRHPHFDQGALVEIDRILVGGNPKGIAVKTGDPHNGPMSREEATLWRDAILNDDDDSYSGLQERTVALLTTIFALRPTSIAHLMESNFHQHMTESGEPVTCSLDVARAKKHVAPGTLHRSITIHPRLAMTIRKLIEGNRVMQPLPKSADERPLLYAVEQKPEFGALGWKASSAGVAAILQRAAQRYGVVSPRFQRPLNVYPTRLRRTAATALAREGYSTEQIAAFLDHEDLQHASVYTDASRGTIEHLDAALADAYAPFFNAFKGAPPKPSATRQRRKTVSYVSDAGSLCRLGECAQDEVCTLNPPYSCYTCEEYEPFSDAEHTLLRDDLLARRARFAKARSLAEKRMAALLDRTIFALAHVKLLIEEMTHARTSD